MRRRLLFPFHLPPTTETGAMAAGGGGGGGAWGRWWPAPHVGPSPPVPCRQVSPWPLANFLRRGGAGEVAGWAARPGPGVGTCCGRERHPRAGRRGGSGGRQGGGSAQGTPGGGMAGGEGAGWGSERSPSSLRGCPDPAYPLSGAVAGAGTGPGRGESRGSPTGHTRSLGTVCRRWAASGGGCPGCASPDLQRQRERATGGLK